jgi:subtilisin family serine protease
LRRYTVVTLALGVKAGEWSRALERAAAALVTDHGVLVVTASGNFRSDACGVSPARVPQTLTAGAYTRPLLSST